MPLPVSQSLSAAWSVVTTCKHLEPRAQSSLPMYEVRGFCQTQVLIAKALTTKALDTSA